MTSFKSRIILRRISTLLFLVPLFSFDIQAQAVPDGFEFFGEDQSIIEGKLSSDFKFLQKNKMNTSYQPAVFTMYRPNGDSIMLQVKIKSRGEFRKQECNFPPIKIKFDKEQFTNSTVSSFNKLKWITHCQSGKSQSDKVIEEYLIYKSYEYLTEFSFRSRLMKIEYVDTENKKSPGVYYAFITENIDQVAERNDAIEQSGNRIHPEAADREISTIMPLAMYMIGFTDWSVLTLHNMKLIQLQNSIRLPIPVPYDFDYSGLIDPSYAVPPEFLGIEDVTQRVYRGFCRLDGEWEDARELFRQNEENILNLWRDNVQLSPRIQKSNLKYLEEFFEIIKDDKKFKRNIINNCRTKLGSEIGGVNY
jgi:hypothetical protein